MKKMIVKEKAKGFLAMGLAIGMFGGLFTMVSNNALAASMDNSVSIPTTYQAEPQEKEATSDYVKANYTVIESQLQPSTNSYALSVDEAAELGAQYLWDMFEVDLDGKVISMFYSTDPGSAIPYWDGYVYDSESKMADVESIPQYNFSIEAITGARAMASNVDLQNDGHVIEYNYSEANNYYKNNCDEYLEAAKILAAKQLEAEPVLAEFISTGAILIESENDYDTDFIGSDTVSASYVYICIMVSDANGNQAEVYINTSDKSLISITNIYKGVNYSPDSLG
ncbi:MAG: hypothetical protein ACRDBO_10380 [Lachnospiraceae bacterium]